MSSASDPLGKAARPIRSRAACSGCRQTKQRCDGPSKIPCRRCELYGILCEYPAHTPAPAPKLAPLRSALPSNYSSSPANPDVGMSDKLREISDRLRSIENSLSHVTISNKGENGAAEFSQTSPQDPLNHYLDSPASTAEASTSQRSNEAGNSKLEGGENPLRIVSESVDRWDAVHADERDDAENSLHQPPGTTLAQNDSALGISSGKKLSLMFPNLIRPDAIERGILTQAQVEASFRIFHRMLGPWVYFYDPGENDAAEMRQRSPLLFHVILLSTAYYLAAGSERGLNVYNSLMNIVNELIAPILTSTQQTELNLNFVHALGLLILYKPVQFQHLYTLGLADTAERAEQLSKLNSQSTATIWWQMHRTAHLIGLRNAPNDLAKFLASADAGVAPPSNLLAEFRLWCWISIIDTHAALTVGRKITIDVSDTLKTIRLFCALKASPSDVRLSATVELYAVARNVLTKNWFSDPKKRASDYELCKINKEFAEWEIFWCDRLEAATKFDRLAMTSIETIATLQKLIINSTVFTRWQFERSAHLSKGESIRPKLTAEEWNSIQNVLNACEKQIFCLSLESRVRNSSIRQIQWPEPQRKIRPPLSLDPIAVENYKTAIDPITCIAFVYPLIVVARMANAALVTCEMSTKNEEMYEQGKINLDKPQRLHAGAKLPCLLRLGAEFLEAIAPTPSHPAKRSARVLRTILAAGTMGQTGPNAPELKEAKKLLRETQNSAEAPTNFPLPAVPQYNPPAHTSDSVSPSVSSPSDGYLTAAAGEALQSILSGLDPSFFGNDIQFLTADTTAGTADDTMQVDWASIETSILAASAPAQFDHQAAFLGPNPSDFYSQAI